MADVKKLKIDGTNYDVKIPSENVKLMTGYSKGSSTNAITPSDSLNSAVGKLECRADKNQDNILYGLNTGVKNVLPYRTAPHVPSDPGITVSLDADNIYKITGTKTVNDSYVELDDVDSSELVGDHVASISVSGTGDFQIAAYGHNGSTWTLMLTTSTSQGFSVGSYTKIKFRIRFTGSLNSSYNANVKAMVCVMGAWGQSHDWQPPALPNYDLTAMEAEDRAALAEEIDAGAKNKFDLSTAAFDAYGGTMSITYNSGSSATIKQVSGGTNLRLPGFVTRLEAGTYILSGCPSGGSDSTYRLDLRSYSGGSAGDVINGSNDYGSGSVSFTITTAGDYYITVRFASGYTIPTAGITVRPMICTKAAFDVSQKFVPYALPNTTITPALIEQVDSGAKNLVRSAAFPKTEAGLTFTMDKGVITVNGTCNTGSDAYGYIFGIYVDVVAGVTYSLVDPSQRSGTNVYTYVSNTDVFGEAKTLYNYETHFTSLVSRTANVIIRVSNGTTYNNVKLSPMICTLADWNVSQKFVPHRTSYQDLSDKKLDRLRSASDGGLISSGDLNSITVNSFALYTNAVSNLPETGSGSGYCFVRTSIFDSNAALQEAIMLQTGTMYTRTKYANTWGEWKKATNS